MKKNNKDLNIKTSRSLTNTCSSCGFKSKEVEKSIKFNKYFCMYCLIDYIKNNT
jgi:uncharacterized ferredoxin-like protein